MMGLGYSELVLVFLIVFLIFGGRKIPEIARGLGRGIREFKNARDDLTTDALASDTATGEGGKTDEASTVQNA